VAQQSRAPLGTFKTQPSHASNILLSVNGTIKLVCKSHLRILKCSSTRLNSFRSGRVGERTSKMKLVASIIKVLKITLFSSPRIKLFSYKARIFDTIFVSVQLILHPTNLLEVEIRK